MRAGRHRLTVTVLVWVLGVGWLAGVADASPQGSVTQRYTALSSVDMGNGSDGWIVGRRGGKTLAEHWNGESWEVVATPNLAVGKAYLQELVAVSSSSPDDAWAVGDATSQKQTKPIIEHWDGSSWQLVSCRLPPHTSYVTLTSTADVSPRDSWIVGTSHTKRSEDPLALHWTGRRCEPNNPPSAGVGNELHAVAASSPKDVWAVGEYFTRGSAVRALVEHWDGTSWSVVAAPSGRKGTRGLWSVSDSSSRDVWAAGWVATRDGRTPAMILHWNGRKWRVVPSVNMKTGSTSLAAIDSSGASDAWAVGVHGHAHSTAPFIEHWNGKVWARDETPRMPARNVWVESVSAVSPRDVWAVGEIVHPQSSHGLVEHWDGKHWSIVPLR